MTSKQLSRLAVIMDDEYRFLSEKFEFITDKTVSEIPKFIVTRKKQNLKRLTRLVFQNELDETEQKIVYMNCVKNIPISRIATDLGISRRAATSILENAKSKLYMFLKYPNMMDFSLINPPMDFEKEMEEPDSEKNCHN